MDWAKTTARRDEKHLIFGISVHLILVHASLRNHYDDVIMSTMASQITSLAIVYSTVYSSTDQRKNQSSASLVFVRGIHRWPVDSPHKGPVTRKMFLFDDIIMIRGCLSIHMSYQYSESHYKDKTVLRSSHLYNGNPYTGKTVSLNRNCPVILKFISDVLVLT